MKLQNAVTQHGTDFVLEVLFGASRRGFCWVLLLEASIRGFC